MEEQNSSKHKNFDLGLNRIIILLVHWAVKAEAVSTWAFSIMGAPEEVDLYLRLGFMLGKRRYLCWKVASAGSENRTEHLGFPVAVCPSLSQISRFQNHSLLTAQPYFKLLFLLLGKLKPISPDCKYRDFCNQIKSSLGQIVLKSDDK